MNTTIPLKASRIPLTAAALAGINGTMLVPLRGNRSFIVAGGPYRNRIEGTFGVKLASEIQAPYDASVPCIDFGVPDIDDLEQGIEQAVQAMVKGYMVYAGCMGGLGRTGLFFACLVKAFGVADPVGFVRRHYMAHAVETEAQRAMVSSFYPTNRTLSMIRWARMKSYVGLQQELV